MGNAGIDNPRSHYGLLNEIPPSITVLAQLYGRFGRRPGASPLTDALDIICDLPGYMSMLMRIFYLKTSKTTAVNIREAQHRAQHDLNEIICLLFLRRGCIHAKIANSLGRSGLFKYDPWQVKCSSCSACSPDWDKMFLQVRHQPVCSMLASNLISNQLSSDVLVVVDRVWKDKANLPVIFVPSRASIRKHHVSTLFMQLIACRLISISYAATEKKFLTTIQLDTDGIPLYRDISKFNGMNIIS